MLKTLLNFIKFLENLTHFVIKNTTLKNCARANATHTSFMLHILHMKSIPKWLPISHTTVDSMATYGHRPQCIYKQSEAV